MKFILSIKFLDTLKKKKTFLEIIKFIIKRNWFKITSTPKNCQNYPWSKTYQWKTQNDQITPKTLKNTWNLKENDQNTHVTSKITINTINLMKMTKITPFPKMTKIIQKSLKWQKYPRNH